MSNKIINSSKNNILWMDLEMTGLDPAADRILEVGVIVTNWKFEIIASYEGVVKVGPRLVERRMFKGPAKDFWADNSNVRDALIGQNLEKGRSGRLIENELIALIEEHFDKDSPVILAGNSIHMDRKFIENEWPRLNKRLHYRMLDVSAWKIVFENKFGKRFAKPEAHRALDDIKGSIEELQYYLKKVNNQSVK